VVNKRVQRTISILTIVLLGQFSVSAAHAANSVGKSCTKIGKVSKTSTGVQLTCEKSGKKLVWKKKSIVVAPVIPAVTDLSKTASLTPKNLFADTAKCKITDVTYTKDVSLGFPRPTGLTANKSIYKALVIPVGFLDAPFTEYDLALLKEKVVQVNDYFKVQSYGKAQIEFTYPETSKWVIFPDNRADHGLSVWVPQESKQSFVQEVLSKTDQSLKIPDYDFVMIETARWTNSGWGQAFPIFSFSSPSGQAKTIILQAGWSVGQWFVVAHEIGHALFGFEDLYSFSAVREKTFAYKATQNWDLMSNAGGSYIGLFSWQRFLASWIEDSEVACVTQPGDFQVYLAPLDSTVNTQKSLQIPIEPGVILVAESRKYSNYDPGAGDGGTLVYVVDTRINHGSEPITVIGFVAKGATATYKNVVITSLDSNSTGELVSVKIS
jgi:M6 family metalloprotease-like protein